MAANFHHESYVPEYDNEVEIEEAATYREEPEPIEVIDLTDDSEDLTEAQEPIAFDLLKVLGQGGFGKVFQCRMSTGPDHGKIFAMKVLRKDYVGRTESNVLHTMAERKILGSVKHPFIVNLRYAFQSESKLYFILEFLNGGELFTAMEKAHKFPEDDAKFYVQEIILAFEYLHSLGIIYRDLKPENVMLDQEGHIKLVDFGLAKENVQDNTRTYSFCGTIQFMAPEVILRDGHGKSADWWTLGVLLYDLTVGVAPFSCRDSTKTMRKIVTGKFCLPNSSSKEMRDLLEGLLKKDPAERLGAPPHGARSIKSHPFFFNTNWSDVLEKKIKPPYKPSVRGADDISQFDTEFTNQALDDGSPNSSASEKYNRHFENMCLRKVAQMHWNSTNFDAFWRPKYQPHEIRAMMTFNQDHMGYNISKFYEYLPESQSL